LEPDAKLPLEIDENEIVVRLMADVGTMKVGRSKYRIALKSGTQLVGDIDFEFAYRPSAIIQPTSVEISIERWDEQETGGLVTLHLDDPTDAASVRIRVDGDWRTQSVEWTTEGTAQIQLLAKRRRGALEANGVLRVQLHDDERVVPLHAQFQPPLRATPRVVILRENEFERTVRLVKANPQVRILDIESDSSWLSTSLRPTSDDGAESQFVITVSRSASVHDARATVTVRYFLNDEPFDTTIQVFRSLPP
jgi:hypothetical protein